MCIWSEDTFWKRASKILVYWKYHSDTVWAGDLTCGALFLAVKGMRASRNRFQVLQSYEIGP